MQRWLDRHLGIPLVAIISLFRQRRALPSRPQKIGFLEPTAIGDLIVDTGLLTEMHAAFPEAELHLFHGQSNSALIPLLPVPIIPHRCNFRKLFSVLRDVRETELDILVDCTSWPRLTALISALSGTYTVGFKTPNQHRHAAYDKTVPHRLDRHEIENRAELSNAVTQKRGTPVPFLVPAPAQVPDIPFDRLVLCHVSPGGSRAQEKTWPSKNWAALARQLAAEKWVLGFTGTAQDAPAISKILDQAKLSTEQAFSLAGHLNFSQLAQALLRAKLLITVDTATLHLGSAMGIPMIGLHGPSPSRRWGATSPEAISIDAPHAASGFIHFGYENHPDALAIMATITVEQVLTAARSKLTDTDPPA